MDWDRLYERFFGFPAIFFLLYGHEEKSERLPSLFGRWACVAYLFEALKAFEKGAIVGEDVDGLWFGWCFGERRGGISEGDGHGG